MCQTAGPCTSFVRMCDRQTVLASEFAKATYAADISALTSSEVNYQTTLMHLQHA